ncbi:glycosyltransferase family 2 protein [Robbsia sp. Bb-Pol-6]|uniref:Glycosyltransferase family 2 protein n=1 Tax=Robbsia betulipollinis TaxID=2981849 RepID=A0ABT3ZQC5_9BURK|nr:glycosyltransferase family 2 protein [Robbsia betulipollinis]MCY0388759.1 glycosyltransferase family 2 protein [Robbsia betulipollinis]
MTERISVVIRTMPGREAHLEKCLFILQGQTYSAIEVVVVVQRLRQNDGIASIERIVDRERHAFHDMRLFEHVCAADARSKSLNIGKRHASGRYLAFLDDDDKLYPEHYDKLISALRESDRAWAYADTIRALHNKWGQVIERSRPWQRDRYSYLDHLRNNFIPIHSFIIDRTRVSHLGDVNEALSMNEDYEFLLRLAFGHEPLYVPFPGAEYCIRGDGSNTVMDGTVCAAQAVRKQRLWTNALAEFNELKIANIGWWVREVDAHPGCAAPGAARYPDNPHATQGTRYRDELRQYHASHSWRVSRALRGIARLLRGQRPTAADPTPETETEALRHIERLLRSRSWRITRPLRWARSVIPRR